MPFKKRCLPILPITFLAAALAVVPGPAAAGEPGPTWHVRTDGSNVNCTGLTNAADPGTGTVPRACAFRTPQQAVDSAAGGDTVLIHAGTYDSAGATVQGNTSIIGLNLRSDLASEETRLTIKGAGDSLGEFRISPGSGVAVGDSPAAAATGDFNRDGKPDLAVANSGSSSVTVLLGLGDGSFSQATGSPVSAGSGPSSIATADFDGDAKADLALTNPAADRVRVLLGNGLGGFTAASSTPVAVAGTPGALATGDFNRDGTADLVTANRGSGTVTVLLGNGSGGFAAGPGSPIAVGSTPRAVAVADINGDGDPDVAVANAGADSLSILLGDGSGGLERAAGSPIATGRTPRSVAAADMNLDGTIDLAVANSGSDTVSVLLGDGAGGFSAAAGSPVATGSTPIWVLAADVTQDDRPDLTVVNSGADTLTVLLGVGNGQFTEAEGSPVAAGSGPQAAAAADFDDDGKPDLAVPNALSDDVTVLLGYGRVLFDGGNTIDTGVTIWGTSFVTIEGITFVRFVADQGPVFTWGAAAVNVGSPGEAAPSSHLFLKSLQVSQSSLENLSGEHADIAIWCVFCTDNTIAHSLIESTQPVAVAVGHDAGTPIEQRGSILENTILRSRDDLPWIGVLAEWTDVWTMDGNYIEQVSMPAPSTDLVQIYESRRWTVTNNVFYKPPRAAVNILDDSSSGDAVEQHRILNNTIECAGQEGNGIQLERGTSCQVRNNIVQDCFAAVALFGANNGTALGYNLLFFNYRNYDISGLPTGYALVGGDVYLDPRFEGVPPRPDPYYRLKTDSPAIDAGDDAYCGVVPDDGECDMGAFQAAGSGGNLPPSKPSVTRVDSITGRAATLHGSAFSDPDQGDRHQASRWQVDLADGDFSNPVFDSGATTSSLTSYRVTVLASSTEFKARVRYRDSRQLWSEWSDPAADPNATFETLSELAVAPKVQSVDPAAGAVGVLVSVQPVVTFQVPLETASVTASNVRLKIGKKDVPQGVGSPQLDAGGQVVTIVPSSVLNPDTKYKIAVRGGDNGIQSREGSIPGKEFTSAFTTESALASSSPARDETGVATDVNPSLVFKWALDPATVTTANFRIIDVSSGRQVALEGITMNGEGTVVSLDPAAPLKTNRKYRIRIVGGSAGLRLADGRQLGMDIKFTFKTGAA